MLKCVLICSPKSLTHMSFQEFLNHMNTYLTLNFFPGMSDEACSWSSKCDQVSFYFFNNNKTYHHETSDPSPSSVIVQKCLLLSISDSWTFTSAQIHSFLSLVGHPIIKWVASCKLQIRIKQISLETQCRWKLYP